MSVELARARAEARMRLTGTTPRRLRQRLRKKTVMRLTQTNPDRRRVLIPMRPSEIAASLTLLGEPGSDDVKIIERFRKGRLRASDSGS